MRLHVFDMLLLACEIATEPAVKLSASPATELVAFAQLSQPQTVGAPSKIICLSNAICLDVRSAKLALPTSWVAERAPTNYIIECSAAEYG